MRRTAIVRSSSLCLFPMLAFLAGGCGDDPAKSTGDVDATVDPDASDVPVTPGGGPAAAPVPVAGQPSATSPAAPRALSFTG